LLLLLSCIKRYLNLLASFDEERVVAIRLCVFFLIAVVTSSANPLVIPKLLHSPLAPRQQKKTNNQNEVSIRMAPLPSESSHPPQGQEEELSASVLGELKETIQVQAQEIQQLKAQLKAATVTASKQPTMTAAPPALTILSVSHGGGHGVISTGMTKDGEGDVITHYLHQPFFKVSLQRVGWLGLFLTSLSMTALIMNVFEKTLEKHIELAYFVPLLAGHGGNTGGQTVGTVLSALSAGTVQPAHAPRVVLKEAMAGIMSGVMLGSIVSPVAFQVLGVSFHVAMVLFFTLPLVSMVASTLGSLIPFACVLLGLDPSVIAAPAMTSIVDVTGLMSYFLIANQIFKLYGLEL
jgi:cation transporter-like permease/uncharacterized small protein (DUF1192 family)